MVLTHLLHTSSFKLTCKECRPCEACQQPTWEVRQQPGRRRISFHRVGQAVDRTDRNEERSLLFDDDVDQLGQLSIRVVFVGLASRATDL